MKKIIKFATLFMGALAICVGGVLINTMPVEAYWIHNGTLYIDCKDNDWNKKDYIQRDIQDESVTSLIVIDTHDNNKIPSFFLRML